MDSEALQKIAQEMRTRMTTKLGEYPKEPVYGAELISWADRIEAAMTSGICKHRTTRVSHYKRTFHKNDGQKIESICKFSHSNATEEEDCFFEKDSIPREKANSLIKKWNVLGKSQNGYYTYELME